MDETKNGDWQQQEDIAGKLGPLGYAAAALLAVPVGVVASVELIYSSSSTFGLASLEKIRHRKSI